MASKRQIANTITAIKTIFGYYAKDGDYDVVATLWERLLTPYTDEQVGKALYACMQECKTPPTPADVIERIKKAERANLPSPSRAWAKLASTLYDVEDLQYDFRYTAVCEDGKTQGEKAREKCHALWDKLPADVKEYVGSYGELLKMARLTDDELKFERARFLKMFPQIQEQMQQAKALSEYKGQDDTKLISNGDVI